MKHAVVITIIALFFVAACREATEQPQGREQALAFREAAELGTLDVHFSKILFAEKIKKKKRFLFVGSSRATHVEKSEAVVTLGIDVDSLSADDVKVTGDRISVLLPPIEIIAFDYDPSHFHVESNLSDYHRSGVVPLSADEADFGAGEIEQLYRDAEHQLRQQLPYKKLRRMAERRTALFFREYLESAGFREVFVNFRQGDLESFRKGGAE